MNYFNNNINYIFLLIIIFSNYSFGKEFDKIFEINHEIKSGESIDKSLNQSFDKMIYRLSGSTKPSNIWKIINAGNSRKDFIVKYTVKDYRGKPHVSSEFNQALLEQTFRKLNIPIIGKSRPVYMVLLEIDNGLSNPYFVSDISTNEMDEHLQNKIANFSSSRGVYIDLPTFDLRDAENLFSYNYLIDPNKYLESKYDYDHLINIKATKVGINEWNLSGDLEETLITENFNKDFSIKFFDMLDSKVSYFLKLISISYETNNIYNIKIEGINNANEYERVKELLNKIIGINGIKVNKFSSKTLYCQVNFYGQFETLMKVIEENSFLNLLETNDTSNNIHIKYKS